MLLGGREEGQGHGMPITIQPLFVSFQLAGKMTYSRDLSNDTIVF